MRKLFLFFVSGILFGCASDPQSLTDSTPTATPPGNLLSELSTLSWMNQPISSTSNGHLEVTVTEGTDFFNNPEDGSIAGTAPLLFKETSGDFVATALVEPDFTDQWSAVSLMVYQDSLNWIKYAFENSDATGPSIVSVVTKGSSDDANGVIFNEQDRLWLKIVRKQDLYALHWSLNGKQYKMTRLTELPTDDPVKIGVEFQSPVGEKAIHRLHYFSLESISVNNLRTLE